MAIRSFWTCAAAACFWRSSPQAASTGALVFAFPKAHAPKEKMRKHPRSAAVPAQPAQSGRLPKDIVGCASQLSDWSGQYVFWAAYRFALFLGRFGSCMVSLCPAGRAVRKKVFLFRRFTCRSVPPDSCRLRSVFWSFPLPHGGPPRPDAPPCQDGAAQSGGDSVS